MFAAVQTDCLVATSRFIHPLIISPFLHCMCYRCIRAAGCCRNRRSRLVTMTCWWCTICGQRLQRLPNPVTASTPPVVIDCDWHSVAAWSVDRVRICPQAVTRPSERRPICRLRCVSSFHSASAPRHLFLCRIHTALLPINSTEHD